MRASKRPWAWVVAVLVAAAGCNSGGPTSSSSGEGSGPIVRGRLLGELSGRAAGTVTAFSSSAAGEIIVRVAESPAIAVKVGSDGTFALRGLPPGSFTLTFTRDGVLLGTQTFTDVQPNQEITITVEVLDGEIVLLDERRTGIGHGDIEIEGLVEKRLSVSTTGDSRFQVDGKVVIARPGVTAIREGNTAKAVADVTVGRRVHVKGVWVEGSTTDVLAQEIKLQGPDTDGETVAEGNVTICHIPPGNPDNKKTLDVGASAVPAHLGHGDTLGPCPAGSGKGNDKGNGGGNGKK